MDPVCSIYKLSRSGDIHSLYIRTPNQKYCCSFTLHRNDTFRSIIWELCRELDISIHNANDFEHKFHVLTQTNSRFTSFEII
jgi:hypothetical protein